VNPDRNLFSINVELTSTFLLYRGLVHQHHRILNRLTIIKRTGRSPPLTYKEDKNEVFSVNALVVSCFIS